MSAQREAELLAEIARLREDGENLDEQVRALVRAEHRSTRTQLELDLQLARVRRLSDFVLSCRTDESAMSIATRAAELLSVCFQVDHSFVVTRTGETELGIVGKPGVLPSPIYEAFHDLAQPFVGKVSDCACAPQLILHCDPTIDSVSPNMTLVVVPLAGDAEITGLTFFRRAAARSSFLSPEPTEKDAPFLQLLASHVNHALLMVAMANDLRNSTRELADANAQLRVSLAETERVQKALAEAGKMEAIGRLAGGVAHDFNNLLTVIIANGHVLRDQLPPQSPLHEDLTPMIGAAERAGQITRQLLVFSRKQEARTEDLALNVVVKDMTQILSRLIGENIDLRVALDPRVGSIKFNRPQLEQVLLNLVTNARDALPQGGAITIETRSARPSEVRRAQAKLDASNYVALVIGDSGHGMDEQTKSRMFDPFFTTKEVGRGTGLGLAIVYGAIQQAEGHILVESEVGQGTRFVLLLRDAAAVGREKALAEPEACATVLLVEDEDAIREVASRVLRRNGFRVVEARNGEEALAAAREEGVLDLLVTDVVMPKLSGVQLAAQLRETRHSLPVLFMSGYTFDELSVAQLREDETFLQKPFSPEQFIVKVLRRLEHRA